MLHSTSCARTHCIKLLGQCRLPVGGSGYNGAVTEQGRDDFPNNFVGDMVETERGWVVVPPTCCPDGHAYSDPGWSASSV